MESTSAARCSKCGGTVTADEKFCSGCGATVVATPDGVFTTARPFDHTNLASGKLQTARKWLLAISILTLIGGLVMFAIQRSSVESQIRDAEQQIVGADPALVDEHMMKEVGMTFEQAKAHDRGMVKLFLAINIALAVVYFGLWFWAKNNPYTAALVALLLFITVVVISGILEPKTLYQGVLVKILFTAALIKAVSEGREARRLSAPAP
ncbi:MAG: hypothetical protein AB7P03_24205 [Kofleriaceae bacterium]